MNLVKLFETQKLLDEHIEKEHPTQLGECANEWRGFKFWSNNQEPRIKEIIINTVVGDPLNHFKYFTGKNPLLEELVDVLHFILSIGIELVKGNFIEELPIKTLTGRTCPDILHQFLYFNSTLVTIKDKYTYGMQIDRDYKFLLEMYKGLTEMLGFTWDQIEAAYFEKNAVNHQRQEQGY